MHAGILMQAMSKQGALQSEKVFRQSESAFMLKHSQRPIA